MKLGLASWLRARRGGPRGGKPEAELGAIPPLVLCDPGWPAYRALVAIARRDGVSVSTAAAVLLAECLTEDDGDDGDDAA